MNAPPPFAAPDFAKQPLFKKNRDATATGKKDVLISGSSEDDAFVVDVPELPGCMAHGNTRAEAIGNAEEAVSFWLQTAKEDGIPIPEPKGRLVVA